MNKKKVLTILISALSLIICQAERSKAAPMGGGFTYQGRLIDGEDAADGLYDLQFKLFDVNTAGDQLGDDINKPDVDIIDGYFTVELDFNDASAFDGDSRWLEIGVRPGELEDPNAYTTLGPRQEITAVPYALQTRGIYVGDTGNVGIGTTKPETKLEVVGGILAGNDGYALSDHFDYGEDQSSHSYECTGECFPGPDFYSCGKDDTLRIGSCSTGTGSVSVIVSVIPDVSHIKLRYRVPWDGGTSGATLYVDGVNKGQIYENDCNWQEKVVTGIAAYTADGKVEIQISDEILGCDGDIQISYLEVYSPINLALDVKGDANITEDLTVSGDVGIGISAPEEKLHVNGKVKTDEVVYKSPRSNYCAISGDNFLPRTNYGSTYKRAYGNSGAYIYSGSAYVMTAPADLPDGALIKEFKVFFYDNHVYNLSAVLLKNWFSTGYSSVAQVDSSDISGYGNKTVTSIDETVNLSTGTYNVHVSATDWSSAGSDLRIMGALITYTITEAP